MTTPTAPVPAATRPDTRSGIRWRDVLIGVAATLLALLLLAGAALWSISSPGDAAAPAPEAGPAPSAPSEPPSDLGPDETWFGDVDLSSALLGTGDGPLRDLTAKGVDVRITEGGIDAGHLDVRATLPFDTAAAQMGEGITLSPAEGGEVAVRRTGQLLGRTLTVDGTGRVEVEDGQLVITPTSVDLGGPSFLDDALSGAAERWVSVKHTVQGLPEGARLTELQVVEDGFAVHLVGDDVRLVS